MLPRSSTSVFTHADIAPRNIMVDAQYRITGIIDWEAAGWYPDYWGYANIMGPAGRFAAIGKNGWTAPHRRNLSATLKDRFTVATILTDLDSLSYLTCQPNAYIDSLA